jgi:hypothetical protein
MSRLKRKSRESFRDLGDDDEIWADSRLLKALPSWGGNFGVDGEMVKRKSRESWRDCGVEGEIWADSRLLKALGYGGGNFGVDGEIG